MCFILNDRKIYRMPMCRKVCYSNTIKIMLFNPDIKLHVPIKLCKALGSIHLFKLTGSIIKENMTLHKNMPMGCNGNRLETSYSNIKWERDLIYQAQ